MSIEDFKEKIKLSADDFKIISNEPQKVFKMSDGLFIGIAVILIALGAFGLGKISAYEKREVPLSVLKKQDSILANTINSQSVNQSKLLVDQTASVGDTAIKDMFVASKTGTKYYYPWCSGVDRIKEENKIWFSSVEEAKSRGLTPASGCTGLK